MAIVNTTGERSSAFEKEFYEVKDDAYEGVISRLAGPFTTPAFKKGDPDQTKIILDCTIPVKCIRIDANGNREKAETAKLPLWCSLVISKGGQNIKGETMSNSKLFDIMDKAGMIADVDAFMKREGAEGEIPDDKLVEFLKQVLVGRTAKLLVATKTNKAGGKYSVVKEVMRFTDRAGPVEEICITEEPKKTGKK